MKGISRQVEHFEHELYRAPTPGSASLFHFYLPQYNVTLGFMIIRVDLYVIQKCKAFNCYSALLGKLSEKYKTY